ncbi:MAG TPA: PDZ domain-containing protein, partial [Burkholderiales bacterium]|nr:PDZ domain-containing protein [Burkholderiales bacterium]
MKSAVPPTAPPRAAQLPGHWLGYALVLALVAAMWLVYAVNLVHWPDSPDFGWRTMYTSGPNVVAQVFGSGEAAGLEPGDRILAINGRPYRSFDELFFGNLRNEEPGSTNTY